MSATFAQRLQLEHAEVAGSLPAAVASSAQRAAALQRVVETGLPGLRDDAWRYTNLRPVEKARVAPAPALDDATLLAGAAPLLPEPLAGFSRFVFVNGRFAAGLSADLHSLSGGTLQALADAEVGDTRPAGQLLDASADERFAWLNEAFATDAARLTVQGELKVELLFITLPTPECGASYPRLEVHAAPHASLTLVERHLGGGGPTALAAASVQVQLGAQAVVEHYRLQACASDAVFQDSLLAMLDADAAYTLSQLNLGGASARNSVRVRLAGERARLTINGMSLADGKRVLDTTFQVEHVGRSTTSQQLLRAIANDQSGIGFNSRVEVYSSAGGADSRQSLKGLIGGPGAEVNLRPQLEISTDEVKASHGATTGALDENTLFYLLSRGLDPDTARKLLEWAFIEDVMRCITLPDLRRQVELATVDRLGNAAAREALL